MKTVRKTNEHLRSALVCAILSAGLLVGHPVGAEDAAYEMPPTLPASDLIPRTLMTGPHHRVDEQVATDGFLTHASISSEFGEFKAVGPGRLEVLVHEIETLAVLQGLEQNEELQKGMKKSLEEKKEGLKHFVEDPKETLEAIPEGVGRFFKRTARSAKTGAQKVQDLREGRAPGVAAETGPGAQLPGGVDTSTEEVTQGELSKAAAKAAGDLAVNALGFDDSRRALAKRLGVDPYATNRVLAEKMDEITWAAFAGDLGVDLVTSMIPGGQLVMTSTRLADWIWDTPPGDLRLEIEGSLLAMGVDQSSVDLLLRHRWYPLSLQAALVSALASLDGVEGRAGIMPLALTVTSHGQARYLVETLRMTARYHKTIKPLQSLDVRGTVTALAQDGELVVAAPVDYLSWSENLDRFTQQPELAVPSRSIHLAGRTTDRARTALQERGWLLIENSELFAPVGR